uniref:Predicted protein n=1 Tax=Hordeum vulgare subsp. vulgare TaxID=112509 RepID=F2EJW0_HORVV|nr:predicted protein [Hordeum vulgare subsp. vulgare]
MPSPLANTHTPSTLLTTPEDETLPATNSQAQQQEMFNRSGPSASRRGPMEGGPRRPYASSTAGREPLLNNNGSNQQQPSQRVSASVSEASFDSYTGRGNPKAYASGAQRFGPSAAAGATYSPSPSGNSSPNPQTSVLLHDYSSRTNSHSSSGKAGAGIAYGGYEDDDMDDALHHISSKKDLESSFDFWSLRGWANAATLAALAGGLVMLFAGYPILSYYTSRSAGANTAGYNLGGINSTGQYPDLGQWAKLIDDDTPAEFMTRTGFDGNEWQLVFSDEFERDGRTFYDGDDPFWTAMDIHYWGTVDFEWYDPSAVYTANGSLVLRMTQEPINNLNFKSGMVQSWNKLCVNKGAYIEVAARLPGDPTVGGWWPGIWTMGNLGRPGYGATNDGTWPYTYDSCDVGTLPNQTNPDGLGPAAALDTGIDDGPLSFLPGQRMSACTCPGEDHAGPDASKGRGAPEIDIVEAQIDITRGQGDVSQSFQVAPFDDFYQPDNTSGLFEQYDTDKSRTNAYLGGVRQQAVSTVTYLDKGIYSRTQGNFGVFGFEYVANPNAREDGYIAWVSDGVQSWTVKADATAANPRTEVGRRIIPEEPLAIIFNLGMSNGFQLVDFNNMHFPDTMLIDYVRIYQRDGMTLGCDPEDYPTADYIERHFDIYNNPNISVFEESSYTWPKNSLVDTC